jgi:serine protease Do
MNPNENIIELLDRFAKGRLSQEEEAYVQDKMGGDSAFRKQAEQHLEFLKAFKAYGKRRDLKNALNIIHNNIAAEAQPPVVADTKVRKLYKKYWPLTAVAASVALISIMGTLYLTQSLETKQTAYYKELRRNVEQIQKSQKRIMADIATSKEKVDLLPATYAGTGFLISPNGYLATSYHVVSGADSVYIVNETYGQLKAKVVFSNDSNDVAILKIESPEFKVSSAMGFTISSAEANLGEDVFTLGFPREDIVFGEGSVSAATGFRQNPNAYQISVPVNPGNSGGPLFNDKGDLVGIINGIQTETSGATFATKSTVLLNTIQQMDLDSISKPLVLPRQNTLKSLNKVQRVKKWKEFVFMIRVYNHN